MSDTYQEQEILKSTSDEKKRRVWLTDQLDCFVGNLPDALLGFFGFHREWIERMSRYQQIMFLEMIHRHDDAVGCRLLDWQLYPQVCRFLREVSANNFRVGTDDTWSGTFGRPAIPHTMKNVKNLDEVRILRNRIVATINDRSCFAPGNHAVLRLLYYRKDAREFPFENGFVEIEADECITPLNDFCFPPGAEVEMSWHEDRRIGFKIFSKKPGSISGPILHWMFPDPSNHMRKEYRDFGYWL